VDINKVACRIADRLMVNYRGDKAKRLQLRGPKEEDFGGMCRECVEVEIQAALQESIVAGELEP
jgi:hypothetical protein